MLTKTVLKGRFDEGSETRNVFYHDASSEGNTAVVAALTEWGNLLLADWVNAVAELWTAYGIDFYKLQATPDDWTLIGVGTVVDGQGTQGGSYNANQDAGVIIGKTATKKVMGRKFIAAMPDSVQVNSLITSAGITVLEAIAADWVTGFLASNGVTLDPGVVSKATGVFHLFLGSVIDAVIGSQRRRKPGVGA